jgi:hypothetical protein
LTDPRLTLLKTKIATNIPISSRDLLFFLADLESRNLSLIRTLEEEDAKWEAECSDLTNAKEK